MKIGFVGLDWQRNAGFRFFIGYASLLHLSCVICILKVGLLIVLTLNLNFWLIVYISFLGNKKRRSRFYSTSSFIVFIYLGRYLLVCCVYSTLFVGLFRLLYFRLLGLIVYELSSGIYLKFYFFWGFQKISFIYFFILIFLFF